MKIQHTNTNTFDLIDGSKKLGQLNYNSSFSYKANAIVGNDNYQITPRGIFSTTIFVTEKDREVATMQMNWNGNIIIHFRNGQVLALKATGIFLNKYVIEDKEHRRIMLLDPDFNWLKFDYSYNISYDGKPHDILLVLLATYLTNYYISSMSVGM